MRILPRSKLTWILLLFICYAYYSDYSQKREIERNTKITIPDAGIIAKNDNNEKLSEKIVTKLKENDTAKVVIEALIKKSVEDKYGKNELRVIAARKTGALTIVDVIRGDGAYLHCGAKAVINYDASLSNGIIFDSTKSKKNITPLTIAIGKTQVIKGLEAGIVGMKVGGRRKISIPPELAYSATGFDNSLISKDEIISYDVELVAVNDSPYKTDTPIIVTDEIEGSGSKVLCGDKVTIKYQLTNIDGVLINDGAGEVKFTLGAGDVPIGFEFAVEDMKVGGKKTVTIPPQLLKIIGKNAEKNLLKIKTDKPLSASLEVISFDTNKK